jgi:predicted peptidase
MAGVQEPREFRMPVPSGVRMAPVDGYRYLLYLPLGYGEDAARRWPLVLFLHGAGERGTDLDDIKRHGLARVVEEGLDLPAIAVSPQCLPDTRWSSRTLSALLDEIERTHAIDPDRVYLTGLSMGGFGAWALAISEPHRFAALAVVCGGGDPLVVCDVKHLPVWAFHGERDEVVPVGRSREMVDALAACGGNVRLTIYPDLAHDSWTETYANPQLYSWLLSQMRNEKQE